MARTLTFFQKTYNLYLRKNKTFIKSKYTRTRQWSKSIVYFGLWFNIISIYFGFLYLYQFYFVFSSYWWLFYVICLSFTMRIFISLPHLFFRNNIMGLYGLLGSSHIFITGQSIYKDFYATYEYIYEELLI